MAVRWDRGEGAGGGGARVSPVVTWEASDLQLISNCVLFSVTMWATLSSNIHPMPLSSHFSAALNIGRPNMHTRNTMVNDSQQSVDPGAPALCTRHVSSSSRP